MKRKKILFVKNYYANPKFITNDLDILRTEYDVTLQNVKNRKNALIIFSLIKQSLYLFAPFFHLQFIFTINKKLMDALI